jgi:hypothetical protein
MALDASTESVDPRLGEGIALFNRGDYYACHDLLEAIWMEANTLEKPFYQGILQVAVGLYHLGNHNWQGASILLGEGVNRLRRFEPAYAGVDVERLVDCGWAWLIALQQTGRERVVEVAAAIPQAQIAPAPREIHGATQEEIQEEILVTIAGIDHPISLPVLHIYFSGEFSGEGSGAI